MALFGLFAGLCSLLALWATASDLREEAVQARWPIASAVIERGGVTAERVSHGSSTVWRLRYRVSYEAGGQERTGTLASRSTMGDAEPPSLREWESHHRRGSRIEIRFDPARPESIVFASPDVPNAGPRTRTDLELLALAAGLCALLLGVARLLKRREDNAGAAPIGAAPSGRIGFGACFSAMGVLLLATGVYAALHADHGLAADQLLFVPAALIFVFGGVLVALPPTSGEWRSVLGALLATALAVTFDWIAFAPGSRRFGGGISIGLAFGFQPSELLGRAVFGVCAVLLDVAALALVFGLLKRALWR